MGNHQFLSTIEPAPPGFSVCEIQKSHLLSSPVVIYTAALEPLLPLVPKFFERVQGIIVTPHLHFERCRIGPLLWHIQLPASMLSSLHDIYVDPLNIIDEAINVRERNFELNLRLERTRLDLDVTRSDYQRVTNKLQTQVRELMASREQQARLQLLLESSNDIVLELDDHGVCIGVWGNVARITGLDKQYFLGQSLSNVFNNVSNEPLTPELGALLALNQHQDIEFSIFNESMRRHLQARITRVSLESQSGYCVILRDISDSKEAQERILYLSQYDTLTGLPNRTLLLDRLEVVIAKARRYHTLLGVLTLDLDRLKVINESLGHSIGDTVICQIAMRIRHELRAEDTLARLSGDEFVLVLSDLESPARAAAVSEKLLQSVSSPLHINGHNIVMTMSIGISFFPQDGEDVEILLKNSDSAMYFAKQTGRNGYQFFTKEMNAHAAERLSLEHALRVALERNELRLHYQPQVDTMSGRIIGAEALIRWQHPQRGLLSPATFITLAEETGLIIPIGNWVIMEACRQVRAWIDSGLPVFPVSVNVSAAQFRKKGGVVSAVRDALCCTGLSPDLLELELTESTIMGQDNSSALLMELRALGVQLAIDDFGTGYSSLSYLKRFPIDRLKIDQSFIRDVAHNAEDAAITTAIISLAKHLNLRVIAEGVETRSELEFLQKHGCDEAQGYYFSRPVPASVITAMLTAGGRVEAAAS